MKKRMAVILQWIKERMAKALKWAAIVFIALVALYLILLFAANRSLRHAYAALEADGRPMKKEQVIPEKIPDWDNAALVYEAVVLQLKAEKAGEQSLFSKLESLGGKILEGTPDVGETEDQFRQLTQTEVFSGALALLRTVEIKKGCRYEIDYSSNTPYKINLGHLGSLKGLSKILCATARTQSADGNYTSAWETVAVSLRVANAMKAEPFVVSQLVRTYQFNQSADTIHALMAVSHPSERRHIEIEELLGDFDDVAPLVRGIDTERILLTEWVFTQSVPVIHDVLDEEPEPLSHVVGLFWTPLWHWDHAANLRLSHTIARNISKPYTLNDATLEEELMNDVSWYCFVTRIIMTGLHKHKSGHFSMLAKARITQAGLAALQYKRENGAYPPDLQTLGKSKLVDPFGGKPLVYRTIPSGFIIYSVGKNLIDDEGSADGGDKAKDIVWRHVEKNKIESED